MARRTFLIALVSLFLVVNLVNAVHKGGDFRVYLESQPMWTGDFSDFTDPS